MNAIKKAIGSTTPKYMFTKSNNQKLSQLPNFILLMTKKTYETKTYYASTFEIHQSLHFDLNFLEIWECDRSICWNNKLWRGWSFNKHLIWKCFHLSLQFFYKFTKMHTIWERFLKAFFCLCNFSSIFFWTQHQN